MKKVLEGKVALISGASGGIGMAVAEAYHAEGALVVLSDIAPSSSGSYQEKMIQTGEMTFIRANLAEVANIKGLVTQTMERFKKIDVLFNNAAIFDMAPFLEESLEMYEKIFSINVRGMWLLMQAVGRVMASNKSGAIINMASQAGRRGEALVAHYCASKAAVISYTQSVALALADEGIRVNAIAPGVIDTPMWETVDGLFAKYEHRPIGEKKQRVGKAVPLGRMGQPNDIVGAAVFLASDAARYITAQTLNVDGGNCMN